MFPSPAIRRSIRACGLLFAAFLLWNCQTATQPPADTILRLKLNDSLSRYDSVVITIVDRQDTNSILEKVWSGKLPVPSQIPGHTLTAAKDRDFIVKVAGYTAGGQLFMETLIYYENGRKTVVHGSAPPYRPRYSLQGLSLSAGKLAPIFNADTLSYQAIIPEGVPSVTINAQPVFSGALMVIDGDTVAAGSLSKPIVMGNTPDTVLISVTDASQGSVFTRTYQVILNPTLPPKVLLAAIIPSIGIMTPSFSPTSQVYGLLIPADQDSVTFVLHPADPGSMTMIFQGVAIFDGQKSRAITVDPGASNVAIMEVYRGSEHTYYQVTIDRPLTP